MFTDDIPVTVSISPKLGHRQNSADGTAPSLRSVEAGSREPLRRKDMHEERMKALVLISARLATIQDLCEGLRVQMSDIGDNYDI